MNLVFICDYTFGINLGVFASQALFKSLLLNSVWSCPFLQSVAPASGAPHGLTCLTPLVYFHSQPHLMSPPVLLLDRSGSLSPRLPSYISSSSELPLFFVTITRTSPDLKPPASALSLTDTRHEVCFLSSCGPAGGPYHRNLSGGHQRFEPE